MRIGILYICTGKYECFWDGFFKTCEEFFLPSHEKHYFVFSDSQNIFSTNSVTSVFQKKLGWPYDTLKRFHMFKKIEGKLLAATDFLIFFNANIRFFAPIEDDYLPTQQEQLLFQQHPGYHHRSRFRFPYERRRQSTSYIPRWKGKHYLAGGVSGGYTKQYIGMANIICRNIDIDEANGMVARWHDESHLNRYALGRSYKLLHPGFMFPDGWSDLPFEKKIRLLDKKDFGGHDFLRSSN